MRWPLTATIALLVAVLAPVAALSEPAPRSHATRAGMYMEVSKKDLSKSCVGYATSHSGRIIVTACHGR